MSWNLFDHIVNDALDLGALAVAVFLGVCLSYAIEKRFKARRLHRSAIYFARQGRHR